MKKTITSISLACAVATVANADFIAGWNFSTANGNSDLSSFAAEFGSGTLDSSNFTQQSEPEPSTPFTRAQASTFEAGVSQTEGASTSPGQVAFNNGLTDSVPQAFQVLVDGAHSGPASFSFSADLTGYTFDSFQFQAKQGASDYTIGLTANGLDLGNITAGTSFSFTDITAASSLNGGGNVGTSLDNQVVTVTFTLTGSDEISNATYLNPYEYSDAFLIDNVTFSGTAVPEPSTFAAIFGVVALGFAAVRRRRS
jgi:hypothetical protein